MISYGFSSAIQSVPSASWQNHPSSWLVVFLVRNILIFSNIISQCFYPLALCWAVWHAATSPKWTWLQRKVHQWLTAIASTSWEFLDMWLEYWVILYSPEKFQLSKLVINPVKLPISFLSYTLVLEAKEVTFFSLHSSCHASYSCCNIGYFLQFLWPVLSCHCREHLYLLFSSSAS